MPFIISSTLARISSLSGSAAAGFGRVPKMSSPVCGWVVSSFFFGSEMDGGDLRNRGGEWKRVMLVVIYC